MVDEEKYGRYVDRSQSLDITTIAACHSPVIEGPFIAQAFERIRSCRRSIRPPLPDQSVLDQIVAATAHASS